MTKEAWKKHIEKTDGVVRPSHGGDKERWYDAVLRHIIYGCRECEDRAKTKARNTDARTRRRVMADLGMVRVKRNLGGTYYE